MGAFGRYSPYPMLVAVPIGYGRSMLFKERPWAIATNMGYTQFGTTLSVFTILCNLQLQQFKTQGRTARNPSVMGSRKTMQ